jgi:hypothetical protein
LIFRRELFYQSTISSLFFAAASWADALPSKPVRFDGQSERYGERIREVNAGSFLRVLSFRPRALTKVRVAAKVKYWDSR